MPEIQVTVTWRSFSSWRFQIFEHVQPNSILVDGQSDCSSFLEMFRNNASLLKPQEGCIF